MLLGRPDKATPMNMTASKQRYDDEFVLEDFVPFQLAVVANRLSSRLSKIIARDKLRIQEWRMLTALERFQPCSALRIVQATAMDPAKVSRAQVRLVDLEFIEVIQDEEDRRRVTLTLTDKGQEIVDELTPEALQTEDWLLADFSPAERDSFRLVMTKLFKSTDSSGGKDG
jgi:DNA-binding MarR family transcriptional regulator